MSIPIGVSPPSAVVHYAAMSSVPPRCSPSDRATPKSFQDEAADLELKTPSPAERYDSPAPRSPTARQKRKQNEEEADVKILKGTPCKARKKDAEEDKGTSSEHEEKSLGPMSSTSKLHVSKYTVGNAERWWSSHCAHALVL